MEKHFDKITEFYKWLTPQLFEVAERHGPGKWEVVYGFVDWNKVFSPIEQDAWSDIRGYGRVPLYPQYPVDKYFVDFGNPVLKVAVECDGKEFHQDKERDKQRDEKLRELGWFVFRISGSDCKKYKESWEDDFEIEKYYSETIEGLLNAIQMIFVEPPKKGEDLHPDFYLAVECLEKRSNGLWSLQIMEDEKKEEDPF